MAILGEDNTSHFDAYFLKYSLDHKLACPFTFTDGYQLMKKPITVHTYSVEERSIKKHVHPVQELKLNWWQPKYQNTPNQNTKICQPKYQVCQPKIYAVLSHFFGVLFAGQTILWAYKKMTNMRYAIYLQSPNTIYIIKQAACLKLVN